MLRRVLRRVLLAVELWRLAERRGSVCTIAAVTRAAAAGGRVQGERSFGVEDGRRAGGSGDCERRRRAGRGQPAPLRRAVILPLLRLGRQAGASCRGRELERGH